MAALESMLRRGHTLSVMNKKWGMGGTEMQADESVGEEGEIMKPHTPPTNAG